MEDELQRALREVRETLLDEPVSPRVEEPADINLHYCRFVAETVAERLGHRDDVEILEDGGRGFVHNWLAHDGRHYDAECPEGVADYRHLPFFERHPEAAIHVEPASVDPASLRTRGLEPLYPAPVLPDVPDGPHWLASPTDRRYALAGVLLGLLLFGLGLAGEWALHHQLVVGTAGLRTLLVDVEVIGELIALVSPIVFFVLLPAHRASHR